MNQFQINDFNYDPFTAFDGIPTPPSSPQQPGTPINRKQRCLRKRNVKSIIRTIHRPSSTSFIMKKEEERSRCRMIRLQIVETDECGEEQELVCTQYIVKDGGGDEVMDQAENLVHSISRKVTGYSYFNIL